MKIPSETELHEALIHFRDQISESGDASTIHAWLARENDSELWSLDVNEPPADFDGVCVRTVFHRYESDAMMLEYARDLLRQLRLQEVVNG